VSEDNTRIKIHIDKAEDAIAISDILERYASECNGCDLDIVISGSEVNAYFEFMSFDEYALEKMMQEIQQKGGHKILCNTWLDNVGEEFFSSIINGKYVSYESIEELEDYEKEITNGLDKPVFNFGKERANQTALIRIQVKAKKKSSAIKTLFETAMDIHEENLHNFKEQFSQLVDSSSHDVKWCGFRWKDDKSWHEGLENLIYGLTFVVHQDEFIYLGFDLNDLNLHSERSRDNDLENLIFVISSLDGVKKTWIKYRPGVKTVKELFIFHPGMGDEPMVLRQPLSEDSEW